MLYLTHGMEAALGQIQSSMHSTKQINRNATVIISSSNTPICIYGHQKHHNIQLQYARLT
jgi:hypothetical protein